VWQFINSTTEEFTRFSYPEPANFYGYLNAVEVRVAAVAVAGFAARAAEAVAAKTAAVAPATVAATAATVAARAAPKLQQHRSTDRRTDRRMDGRIDRPTSFDAQCHFWFTLNLKD
jgi:uncharacterized membrane protein YphA (DoxX/SURF4 family)